MAVVEVVVGMDMGMVDIRMVDKEMVVDLSRQNFVEVVGMDMDMEIHKVDMEMVVDLDFR